MGWALGAALTPALRAAYGWVGALLWAQAIAPPRAVEGMLWHVSLLVGGALAVPLLMFSAATNGSVALIRLCGAVAGVLAADPLATWLWQLNSALVTTIAVAAGSGAIVHPSFGQSLIDLLVFGVPYLLLLAFLALLLVLRLAFLVLLVGVGPLAWLGLIHPVFARLPVLWLWQVAVWSLLPASEALVLVSVRALAGELPIPAPASDMLIGLALLYVMVRLPFTLLRAGRARLLR